VLSRLLPSNGQGIVGVEHVLIAVDTFTICHVTGLTSPSSLSTFLKRYQHSDGYMCPHRDIF
jgi:hypothetical protein